MSTEVAVVKAPVVEVRTFDPFQLMDRLDENALVREMEGQSVAEWVYEVKDSAGKETTGLSKVGVDECCMMLVKQRQVIREEDITFEMIGEGEEKEALFKCIAARYAVDGNGAEVKLDTVFGVKRQPLYGEPAAPMSLDSRCPGKKPNGRTFRQMMETDDGRDYLGWMSREFKDEATREFVKKVLDGEEAVVTAGRKLNPFWYEHGAMKSARNARFRLVPTEVKAKVMAAAKAQGKVLKVSADGQQEGMQLEQRPAEPVEITRDTVFDYGTRIKGKKLRDIPVKVLEWMIEQDEEGDLKHQFAPSSVIDAWVDAVIGELAQRKVDEAKLQAEAEEALKAGKSGTAAGYENAGKRQELPEDEEGPGQGDMEDATGVDVNDIFGNR